MKNRTALGWGELIIGILLIVLAIYTFINPVTAMTGVTVIYAIFALITGVADIVYYVKLERRTGAAPVISLVAGIISVIAGILILFNINTGTWVLVTLFPIWFLAHCIARLAHLPYIRSAGGGTYYYFTLVINILGLILAILMICNPLFSFLSIGYLISIYLLFLGIDGIIFALNLLDSRR